MQDEQDLVQRAQQGDKEAFTQLYETHFNKIYRYVILRIGNKAELYATLADRRVAEIAYMVNRGKPQHVERTTQRLNAYQTRIAVLAATEKATSDVAMATAIEEAPAARGAPGQARQARERMAARYRGERLARLRVIVVYYAINHPARLRALLERAPESVKPALQRAINISVASYQKALEDLD